MAEATYLKVFGYGKRGIRGLWNASVRIISLRPSARRLCWPALCI